MIGPRDFHIVTPRLTLTLPDLQMAIETADAVNRDQINDPGTQPLRDNWLNLAAEERHVEVVRLLTEARRGLSQRIGWSLPLVGVESDSQEVVGCWQVNGGHFADHGVFGGTSWVLQKFQHTGMVKEMRAAALTLMFDHLGAEGVAVQTEISNTRMIKSLEHSGYARTQDLSYDTPNGVRNVFRYEYDRDSWKRDRADWPPATVNNLDVLTRSLRSGSGLKSRMGQQQDSDLLL